MNASFRRMMGLRGRWALVIGLCLWSQPAPSESAQLHRAARTGDVAAIERLVAAGADVNAKSSKGRTPVHWAAASGQVSAIRALAKAGAAIDAGDEERYTALALAARQGHVAAVDALVNLGANVNAMSRQGATPLHEAAVWGQAEAVRALLRAGADIRAKDDGNSTALHFAVINDRVAGNRQAETAAVLLASPGIAVNAKNAKGRTALHLACAYGDAEVIGALLNASADLEAREPKYAATPLHYAAALGNVAAIETLVAAGADVQVKDRLGQTPRTYAEKAGHAVAVTALADALKPRASAKAAASVVTDDFSSQRSAGRDSQPAGFSDRASAGQLAAADDAGQANRLMVEAIKAMKAAEIEPSAEGKYNLLKQAFDKLKEIVERYPSTDLAVKLATGQRVGKVSLAGVREALDAARVGGSRTPGARVRVWHHRDVLLAVALMANGRQAITVSRDGNAVVRDVETGEVVRRWRHRGRIVTAALSRNGRRMLTIGRDRNAMVHDTRTGTLVASWQEESLFTGDSPFPAALSPNGRRALTGVHSARLIDVDALEVVRNWRDRKPVGAFAFSPNGRRALIVLADGKVLLRDLRTGKTLRQWKSPGSGGSLGSKSGKAAVFSPDGKRAVIVMREAVVLRDVATGKALRAWRPGGNHAVSAVAYSPDGRWVLTGDQRYEARLHDVSTGKAVREWRYDAAVEAVAFSRNGRRVLMGFHDGAAILCDLAVSRNQRKERTYLTRDRGCR